MQYKMTADGASASGTIRLTSKKGVLNVSGDYNAVFKVEGTLNKKTEKDVFDRYLVGVGKAIASKWMKFETKAISNFTSELNKAEKAIEKLALSDGQSKVKTETARLENELKIKAEAEFKSQMDKFVGDAHSDALKSMDKTAKSVLKDKRKLIFKAGAIVVGLGVTIATAIMAPPVGAAAIAVAVLGCLSAAAKSAQDGLKLSNEFIGNYKTYNKSLGELSTKIDETIRFARACEAKRDQLLIKKGEIEMQMEKIKKEDPGAALRGSGELKAVEDQLKTMNASLDRMADYSAKDVEKSLSSARGLIKELEGAPYMERGTKVSGVLGGFIKAAAVAIKAIKKLSK